MQQFINYATGMRMGQGLDLATGKQFSNAAVAASGPPTTAFGGLSTSIEVSVATSKEDVDRSLSVSADVNLNYGVFKSSAHMKLMQSLSVNRYAVYVTIVISGLYDVLQPDKFSMASDASNFWSGSGAEAFAQRYGHAFIAGMQSGGALFAVLEIVANSETELKELQTSGSIGGAVGKASGDASFDVTTKLKSLRSLTNTRLRAFTVGGPAIGTPTTLDDLIAAAGTFTKGLTPDNACGMTALVGSYEDLYQGPATGETLPDNQPLTPLSLGNYLIDVLETTDAAITKAQGLRADYYYALANPQLFILPVSQIQQQYADEISALEAYLTRVKVDKLAYLKAISSLPQPSLVPPPNWSDGQPAETGLADLRDSDVATYNIVFPGNGLLFGVAPTASDPNGFLTLQVFDKTDPLQRWIAVKDAQNPLNPYVQLVNASTKNLMTAPMPGTGAAMSQTLFSNPTPPIMLTRFSLIPQSNGLFEVSPAYDNDQAMAAVGDLFVTGVFVGQQGWDGGGRNDQFAFYPAEIIDPQVPPIPTPAFAA